VRYRFSASIDLALKRGKASVHTLGGQLIETIADRDISNNKCSCGQ
jgi:hypothetical protein